MLQLLLIICCGHILWSRFYIYYIFYIYKYIYHYIYIFFTISEEVCMESKLLNRAMIQVRSIYLEITILHLSEEPCWHFSHMHYCFLNCFWICVSAKRVLNITRIRNKKLCCWKLSWIRSVCQVAGLSNKWQIIFTSVLFVKLIILLCPQ